MSLKFTALEVGSGDAFLLEDDDKKILFDSGGSKTKIVALLKKKGIKKIDLAICSHNDKDHSNGFLGLLNSKIVIGEIWLPGTWASIIHSVAGFIRRGYIYCKNGCCWCDKFIDCMCHFGFKEGGSELYYNELLPYGDEITNGQLMEDLCFINALLEDGCLVCCRNCEDKVQEMSESRRFREENCFNSFSECCRKTISKGKYHIGEHAVKLMIQLDAIISIAEAAYKNGVSIRWFEPTDACIKKRINTNIIVLNSGELARAIMTRRIDSPYMLMYALTLTMENKYSLAMEYLHDEIPVVRFSADSDSICQSNMPYGNNIIVTAPHHGSEANANVYGAIKGNDIIWVRSDGKTSKRPCDDFKCLPNKFCLTCHTLKFKSEICFEYDNSTKRWLCKTGTRCICKPRKK